MYLRVKFFCHPQKLFISMHLIVVCLSSLFIYFSYFIFSPIATDGINEKLGVLLKKKVSVSVFMQHFFFFFACPV